MRRINLQLFALTAKKRDIYNNILNNGGSVSQANRAVTNYSADYKVSDNAYNRNGDAARNVYNNILNNNGSLAQASKAAGYVGGLKVSDNAYQNKAALNNNGQWYNRYGQNVTDYYGALKDYYKNGSGGYGGIGGISPFKASQAYTDAMNYTNSLLEKLNSGRTSYSDKIDALMSKIEGRDKFSYDFNTDPLFQNALASAMASGQTAMQDTMGQAAALTGGYGSSYATSAANQAYNNFVKEAYDELPEFYNMALNAYNQEGQELYNQLGMYQTADATEYDRLANAYSANLANAQNIYSQEYNNYWDTANYNQAAAKYNADLKYKYDALKADQLQSYAKYYGSSGTSGANGSSGTNATSAISSSEWNSLKSDLKTLVEAYGADSPKVEEFILSADNRLGLSDDEIKAL